MYSGGTADAVPQETFRKQSHAEVTNPPDAYQDVQPTEHQTPTSETGAPVSDVGVAVSLAELEDQK